MKNQIQHTPPETRVLLAFADGLVNYDDVAAVFFYPNRTHCSITLKNGETVLRKYFDKEPDSSTMPEFNFTPVFRPTQLFAFISGGNKIPKVQEI